MYTRFLLNFCQPLTSWRLSEAVFFSMVWIVSKYYSCSGQSLGGPRPSKTQKLIEISFHTISIIVFRTPALMFQCHNFFLQWNLYSNSMCFDKIQVIYMKNLYYSISNSSLKHREGNIFNKLINIKTWLNIQTWIFFKNQLNIQVQINVQVSSI